jgi:hypothetical protein
MKNVEDTFKNKIERTTDPEIAKNRIWDKIEAKLDEKPKPIINWWRLAIAASVVLLIGLAFLISDKTFNTKTEIAVVNNTPVKIKERNIVNDVKEKKTKIKKRKIEFKKSRIKKLRYIATEEQIKKAKKPNKMIIEPILKSKSMKEIPTVLLTDLLTNLKKDIKISSPENIGNKPKFRTIHTDEFEQIKTENPVKQRAFVVKMGRQEEGQVETNSLIIPLQKKN